MFSPYHVTDFQKKPVLPAARLIGHPYPPLLVLTLQGIQAKTFVKMEQYMAIPARSQRLPKSARQLTTIRFARRLNFTALIRD